MAQLILVRHGQSLWDDEKARINSINHEGITFQQAVETFFDPFLVVVDASRNEEARDAGITSGRLCQRARCSVESTVCGKIVTIDCMKAFHLPSSG